MRVCVPPHPGGAGIYHAPSLPIHHGGARIYHIPRQGGRWERGWGGW